MDIPYNITGLQSLKATTILFFLASDEGQQWWENYLSNLSGTPRSLGTQGLAKWVICDGLPLDFSNTRDGWPSSNHPLCLAAAAYADNHNFVTFMLTEADVNTDRYYGKAVTMFFGHLVLNTEWFTRTEAELKKDIRNLKKVEKIIAA
jgi:hypothetical protein